MATSLRIAVTADLHWGHNSRGDAATTLLRDFLETDPPDVLLLGGDIGTADHFGNCLALFSGLPSVRAVVPGNHDVWVMPDDQRGDSLRVYRHHLPAVCDANGVFYLDNSPLMLPEADLAVVGTMNWYDYTWALDLLKEHHEDWEERLKTKRFTRGRHNDSRFVRWPHSDESFTAEIVATFARHLDTAFEQVGHALVVTHHPPMYDMSFPGEQTTLLDDLMWDALAGNRTMEELLQRNANRVPFVFCGHTHWAREHSVGPLRGYNVGGDYQFKRLLMVEWPQGTVTAHEFRVPG
jgi:predicted phosphohydrolase